MSGEILQYGPGGQVDGRAGDRPAGVRARACEVEPVDTAEAPTVDAPLEELVAEHLAVEDVAARDAEALLELPRPEREPVEHASGQVGTGLGEARDRGVGRGLGVDVRREALAEQ